MAKLRYVRIVCFPLNKALYDSYCYIINVMLFATFEECRLCNTVTHQLEMVLFFINNSDQHDNTLQNRIRSEDPPP